MRNNRVRELFDSDELLLDTRIHSPWANEIDMIGCSALNTVQVVAEYGALETLDFENLCRAAEANNLGKIIKIDSAGQQRRVQRAIGAGFEAVVVSKPGKRVPLDFALWKLVSLVTPRAGSAALRLGALTHLGRLAPLVNLWDIMTVVARKRPLGMTPSPEDVSTHRYDSLVNRS